MKRRTFVAELRDGETVVAMTQRFAMNSGIRASEGLARDYALAANIVLEGSGPWRVGQTYTRSWHAPGVELTAVVTEVTM